MFFVVTTASTTPQNIFLGNLGELMDWNY